MRNTRIFLLLKKFWDQNKKGLKGKKMSFLSKFFSLVKKNKIITILFCLSTAFFIIQHTTGLSWDFVVYVLNAKYLFANGFYFEWERPIITPLLLGVFSFFGWLFAEYAYIIFASGLHFFATIKLSKQLKISPFIFYGLSLTPFLLIGGLSVGTELLYFALLELTIALILAKKSSSGIFLSLATIAHYTNIIFLPLLLFNKKFKKILTSFILFALPILAWLLFNYILTGNALTSVVNSYALNVYFRGYLFTPFNVKQFLAAASYYLIFAIASIALLIKNKKIKKEGLIMLLFFFLVIVSYIRIPLKSARYLFPIILPLAYFTTVFIKGLKTKTALKLITIIIIINFLFAFSSIFFAPLTNPAPFKQATSKIEEIDKTKSCMLISNEWVFFNYLGRPTEPAPWKEKLNDSISEGNRILLYKSIAEPEYIKDKDFLYKFPVLEENEEYILLGNKSVCKPEHIVDSTYLERLFKNTGIKISNCEILLPKLLHLFCKS